MGTSTESHSMVLAFASERAECARLRAVVESLRHDIATLDMSIEHERASLSAFEQRYRVALEREHALLARIDAFLRHLASLGRLVGDTNIRPTERRDHLRMLHRLRAKELTAWHERRLAAKRAEAAPSATAEPSHPSAPHEALDHAQRMTEQQERMRTLYRQLARRYHPDLARDEASRAQHSRLMAHVNALYAQNDLERLAALGARTSESAADALFTADAIDWHDALEGIREQHVWSAAIHDSLQQEAKELSACSVAELRRAVERPRRPAPRDPFDPLRADAKRRAKEQMQHVPAAIFSLEQRVKRARSQARKPSVVATTTLPQTPVAFDPHVGHMLCKLSLQALDKQRLPPRVQRMADAIAALGQNEPALLRVVLLAYVAELTPQPLDALSSYDAIATRFDALAQHDERVPSLADTLVQGDGLVQYRIDRAHTHAPRLTLGLRDRALMQAVAGALEVPCVRDEFAHVLLHLGEAVSCTSCRRNSFAVPLFLLRGIDDLRATVCAHCGGAIRRYVLARGEDVQAVLNQAYLDMGLLYECSIGIGRRQVAVQYLARQMPTLTARDVTARLCQDLFLRNGLSVRPSDVALHNDDKALGPQTLLAGLFEPSLRLVGRGAHGGRERAWCEELGFRVRTRYGPRSNLRP